LWKSYVRCNAFADIFCQGSPCHHSLQFSPLRPCPDRLRGGLQTQEMAQLLAEDLPNQGLVTLAPQVGLDRVGAGLTRKYPQRNSTGKLPAAHVVTVNPALLQLGQGTQGQRFVRK